MHVVDRRNRKKGASEQIKSPGAVDIANPMDQVVVTNFDVEVGDAPGDNGSWLSPTKGNRINRIVGSPGEEVFGPYLLERVFG
jgi:hypothetical protein